MIRVACIGAGAWGANLLRNFARLNVLYAVCDTHRETLQAAASAYPGAKAVGQVEAVLDDARVDAVAIATPAGTHADLAKRVLAAGKDVFVEKPLALTLEEGRSVVEAADRAARILMVGHILHYHPAVKALRHLIARGDLGKLQYVYSSRLNIGKVRREENILWSFAPHDLSALLYLVGQEPDVVQANGGTYLQQGVPDVTLTTFAFPGGVRGHVFVSWLHPFKEQKLVVVGSRKMAVFDDLAKDKLLLYPHEVDWIEQIPVAHRAEAAVVPLEMEEPLAAECRHFLDCVARRTTPQTDGQEALRVLRVLQAAQDSLDRGGAGCAPARTDLRFPGCLIHETAVVDEPADILAGTRLWHFSHVLAGSRIGADCSIGQNVTVGPNVSVGNRVKIQNNVSVYEGVTLEDFVFCGPSVVFTNVVNPRSAVPRKSEFKPTRVQYGATLGANSTILCGVTIGRHAFVGAGAVVTRSIPDHALVMGNPAKQTGWMCACGVKLAVAKGGARCTACGARYTVSPARGCRRIDEAGPARTARADVRQDGRAAKHHSRKRAKTKGTGTSRRGHTR